VLELGAAAGYFTAWLRSRGCDVDVVELNADAAREASVHARRTVVADLDGERWLAELDGARYDTVVCADVLEHLRDGGRLLERIRGLLAENGELLLSVPNVAHSAVIAGLLDERFDYGGEGLLDPTHVRLYTWRSLAAALGGAGFVAREWDATLVELYDSEFRVRSEGLAPGLREALVARPNANVYQWLVRAAPGDATAQTSPAPVQGVQHVPVRLLHGATQDALSLDHAIVARLAVGAPPTALEWRLPASAPAQRLLLADRVGRIDVHELRLHAGDSLLWSSAGHAEPFRLSPSAVPLGEHAIALIAPDAWLAPAVSDALAAQADRVTATLAWPDSVAHAGEFDVLGALAAAMRRRDEAAQREHDDLVAKLREAERRHADEAQARARESASLIETRDALSRRSADVERLEQSLEGYRTENARLDAALAAQERIIAYRQSVRWWLKLPLVRIKWWWHQLADRR
jgi:SAM-dependent methyltransferase